MNEEESLSLLSALTAPTDCTVLSLGVSAEPGDMREAESAAAAAAGSELGTGSDDVGLQY